MSVFYKFKSALTYDTIQFDDLHISLQDFKKAVIQQKQLGKNTNFDLQVTNAETNEVYSEENSLIPKNSSLIVVRIPLTGAQKKPWDIGEQLSSKIGVLSSDYLQENAGNIVVKSADLVALNASEDDKIQAMMFQSTVDYDPSNYLRVKGGSQFGEPPPAYVCHKCLNPGHWIKDCPITVVPDIKKSSGIPQSFMTPVEDASAPGALMTPAGTFAVPTIDLQAYKEGKKEKPFIPTDETEVSLKPNIPEDLTCSLCQDLLTDAVMMPCCGNSFCDECIRNVLLESEDNQCPDCKEKDTSPETLIPNRFLRNAVNNFRNKTGYKGGGQRVKRNEAACSKSPAIDHDQDVEIVDTVPAEIITKPEPEIEQETGSAIVVLGSGRPQISRGTLRTQINGASKMPTIHVEHRPPVGRPKVMQPEMNSLSKDAQRNLVGNGVRSSPDISRDDRNKLSPGLVNVPSHAPPVNKYTSAPPAVPNTSQLPPGYSQQTLQPIGPPFRSAPPIIPNYAPPPNPMIVPQHITSQSSTGRMFPFTGPPPMYTSHMGGYRGGPGHQRIRQHHDGYSDRNVVDDPLAAFERHLRERERQDRMKRNRARRSRSRSHSRPKSRPRSRPRSRSRSLSKKRSSSKSPLMRKESPLLSRSSRTPPNILRRSKSKSRSRTRLRSRSRSHARSSIPRSRSLTPLMNVKKKRSISLSPPPLSFKKQTRSPSPITKKSLRLSVNRSRTRSRTRSKSISRSRKRRRTRSRSRSGNSRSISRGRSFSRSLTPRRRGAYSPNFNHPRVKRRSRSPPRHTVPSPLNVRHRSNHYRDISPYQSGQYYDTGDRYKRGSRNQRYIRNFQRYSNAHQNYDSNKYDRHGNVIERYEEKRYPETSNGRGYVSSNDYSKNRKDAYYSPPPDHYEHFDSAYGEVAPPGTTDIPPEFGYTSNLQFPEPISTFNYRRSPEYDHASGAHTTNYKDTMMQDEYKKTKDYDRDKDHDHHRLKSRDRPSHNHYFEHEKTKRPSSRSRHPSHSPSSRDKKHRSGRIGDKENKSRVDRASSNKRDSNDRSVEYEKSDRLMESKEFRREQTPDHEKQKKEEEKKEEHRDKKDKSKRKKKKESDAEKKKKKKPKVVKKDEDIKNDARKTEKRTDDQLDDAASDENKVPETEISDELYGDIEGTKVDKKIIESYGKIGKFDDDSSHEKVSSKSNEVILAAVPELSKWEREDFSSPSDERGYSSKSEFDDKNLVTNEIIKRAENVLFQKATKSTTKNDSVLIQEKDELLVIENAREARKSGNSIQVTVPAVITKSEDESRPAGRISAKDRLGAKVEEKNYTIVRSLVEPKIKPRSAVKAVIDVKHVKVESNKHDKHEKYEKLEKHEKHDKHDKHDKRDKHEKTEKTDKHDEKKKKEANRLTEVKRSKHRDTKEKSKHLQKSSEDEPKPKKDISKETEATHDKTAEELVKENVKLTDSGPEKPQDNVEMKTNEVAAILDKKRPTIDEANFEPDYDLTSESDGEVIEKECVQEPSETLETAHDSTKDAKQSTEKPKVQKMLTPIEQLDDVSSTESSSETSSDSSTERKKRKKRKAKKKKKLKKRRAYSSDSDSDDSSESDSDSDTKLKHKKKRKHKSKKSKSTKKKKKSKHK